ncbi:unnamed protein product [Camellia sinensis]
MKSAWNRDLRQISQPHSKIINILALNSPISEQRPPSQTSRIGAPSESGPLTAERGLQGQRPGGGDLRQQRHCWQEEEKCLLRQIDSGEEEITRLRATVEELEKSEAEMRQNVEELRRVNEERNHEMLNFMAARSEFEEFSDCGGGGECCSESARFGEVGVLERVEMGDLYGQGNGFSSEFLNSASKLLQEKDVQYESVESLCHLKHFVSRRESPWKVDGESTGVSSKLELLEHELMKLERIGKGDQSKAQRQTEFLLEAFRLQQHASETGQKLMALKTETGKSDFGDELEGHTKLTTQQCLDSIKNNFKEIQRNLEIWLARIIGDLEGILARDGASRVREYYISRYPS